MDIVEWDDDEKTKTNNLGPKNIIYEQIKKKSIRKEKKKRGKKR